MLGSRGDACQRPGNVPSCRNDPFALVFFGLKFDRLSHVATNLMADVLRHRDEAGHCGRKAHTPRTLSFPSAKAIIMKTRKHHLSWRLLFSQTILAVYIYVFMEWLFFATKPSFMDAIPLGKKVELLLLTGLVPALAVLPVLIVLRIFGWIPGLLKRRQALLRLGAVLPSFVAAPLSLLLIDNFTNTIFQAGIVTSRNYVRAGYGVMAVVLLAAWYRQAIVNMRLRNTVRSAEANPEEKIRMATWQSAQLVLASVLLVVSLAIGAARVASATDILGEEITLLERPPNIIMIGGDGTSAFNMSLHGNERDTTPNFKRLPVTADEKKGNPTGHFTPSTPAITNQNTLTQDCPFAFPSCLTTDP